MGENGNEEGGTLNAQRLTLNAQVSGEAISIQLKPACQADYQSVGTNMFVGTISSRPQ
jgi:hypothetical protein